MSRVSKLRDRYLREVVRKFLADGYVITVNNGHFNVCNRESDYGLICDAMQSADFDILSVFSSPVVKVHPFALGWVEVSHVNNYTDMFVDFSPSLAHLIESYEERLRAEVIPDARKRNG